jgi:hypothetical protein
MSDSPFELQRLVTIGVFNTPWEAQIAKARLAAEGLHALIADEHLMRMVALSNATGGIQLKVREPDAGAAAEVLQRLAPLPEIYLVTQDGGGMAAAAEPVAAGEPAMHCPACGSGDLRPERSSRLMLGVLPVSRKGYRCGECGLLWAAGEIGSSPAQDRFVQDLPEPPAAAPRGDHLAAGEEEAEGALITVARFHTPWEAHLARTLLESEGVRCCVLEQRLLAVHLLSAEPTAWNRLEVRQGDATRAARILARAWSQSPAAAGGGPDPDPDSDPDSDSEGD